MKVDLPQADAEPLPSEADDPVVVSVDLNGDFFIDVGEGKNDPVDEDTLITRVAAVLKYKPRTPIMVRGDRNGKENVREANEPRIHRKQVSEVGTP